MMGFKIKKTVNGETVWQPIKAKKYTTSKIIEYTGALPITISANGDMLIDYRIYGADVGVGERTENLFDNRTRGYYNNDNGNFVNDKSRSYWRIPVQKGDIVYANDKNYMGYGCCFYQGTYVPNSRLIPANFPYTVPAGVDEVTNNYPAGSSSAMVTVNRATPTTYIPYGYKLPMTVGKNLYNPKNDIPGYYININGEIIKWGSNVNCISDKIPVLPGKEYTLYYPLTMNGTAIVCAFYNDSDIPLRIVSVESTTPPYEKIYNLVAPANAAYFRTSIKRDPDSEPITMFVEHMYDTPVYIGENQLEEDEYVSYGEQKIYRDVSGILTPTDPPVLLTDIPTIKGETVIDYDGTPKPSQMYAKYNSWSGWSDIDNYKMANGNWTQEVT